MKYVFHPEAVGEYAEAVQYYAEQRTEVAQAFIVGTIMFPDENEYNRVYDGDRLIFLIRDH